MSNEQELYLIVNPGRPDPVDHWITSAQRNLQKEAHDAQHSDAMAAVDAGLGGDNSRKGLLAGLAATSERLRELEAEGADAHSWLPTKTHQQHVATSSEVLAELKNEAKQELKSSVAAELNSDPYPTHVAEASRWPHEVPPPRIVATRGREWTDSDLSWGYGEHDGPRTWGDKFHRCSDGQKQSPVDIEGAAKSTQPEDILDIAILRWVLNNGDQKAKMAGAAQKGGGEDNNEKKEADLGDKSQQGLFLTLPVNSRFQEAVAPPESTQRRLFAATEVYTGHALEVEGLGSAKLEVDGTWYDLREVLLHTPSEHTVDGKPYDLEMQLVHVVEQGQGGYRYLVVSVLFSAQSGDPSPAFLSEIAAAVPSVRESRRVRVERVAVDKMTEAVQEPLRSYYRYQGSLTTPPCTEGVQWFVAAREMPLSRSDLDVIAALQGSNNRPVQPLNGRTVRLPASERDSVTAA